MDFQERKDIEYGNFTMENINTQELNLEDFQRRRRMYRCAVVCLALLCVVLLAANIGQIVNKKTENHSELANHPRSEALSAWKDQLCGNWTAIQTQNLQLHLQNRILMLEKEQLQNNYTAVQRLSEQLQAGRDQLQKKVDVMEGKIRGLSCKTGWHKFGLNCYYASTIKLSWMPSRMACLALGGDLVSFNTMEEQAFVNTLLEAKQNAWIGLIDYQTEGTWTWLDGTPVTTTLWRPGQPNSYNGTEQDCGEIVQDSSVGAWNDEDCTDKNIWICES